MMQWFPQKTLSVGSESFSDKKKYIVTSLRWIVLLMYCAAIKSLGLTSFPTGSLRRLPSHHPPTCYSFPPHFFFPFRLTFNTGPHMEHRWTRLLSFPPLSLSEKHNKAPPLHTPVQWCLRLPVVPRSSFSNEALRKLGGTLPGLCKPAVTTTMLTPPRHPPPPPPGHSHSVLGSAFPWFCTFLDWLFEASVGGPAPLLETCLPPSKVLSASSSGSLRGLFSGLLFHCATPL